MAFLGLLFQDNDIRLTVEQIANEGLISVAKRTLLVDSNTEMKLSNYTGRESMAWGGHRQVDWV